MATINIMLLAATAITLSLQPTAHGEATAIAAGFIHGLQQDRCRSNAACSLFIAWPQLGATMARMPSRPTTTTVLFMVPLL